MSEHRLELDVCAPTAQVVALLSVRPATWLRSFLRLATLEAAANTAALGPPGVTRCRLGPPALDRSGAVAIPLTWWPHLDGEVHFGRFKGRFVVRPGEMGTILALEGETTGGTPERAASVLHALLELLGAAVSVDQEPDG
jgi:hypothetical protein